MNFSLIICTYQRPLSLVRLLKSICEQSCYPSEILIVDGSFDENTKQILELEFFENLHYFKVSEQERGLTKQRNFGISKVASTSEVICFLDDDTLLEPTYFEELLQTYSLYPEALGAGGYITNEVIWTKTGKDYVPKLNEFAFDNYKRKDGSRFVLRKKLGLDSDAPPGFSTSFSHGRSVGFLPPSGKIYEVEQVMGGVSSFRKKVFDSHRFSTYFEGYGLYEDADFSIRVAKTGKLYLNTNAKLEHHHDFSGRPNSYLYGKMVVRNGWYVWRVKNPKPDFKSKIKWHSITIILTWIRFGNSIKGKDKKQAIQEAIGRTIGWWSLIFNKPKRTK